MLSRYEGKVIKITTTDGSVFFGTAQTFPSGYGLQEFNIEEESVQLQGTQIFLSEIETIEELTMDKEQELSKEAANSLMGTLINGPYRIADILPYPVKKDAGGQHFAVDRYFRLPGQMAQIRKKQAEILLKLNCCYDMSVSFDNCESWRINPDPQEFVKELSALSGNTFLRALFASQKTMIDIEPNMTEMTIYCHQPVMLELIEKLTQSEGFFLGELREEN